MWQSLDSQYPLNVESQKLMLIQTIIRTTEFFHVNAEQLVINLFLKYVKSVQIRCFLDYFKYYSEIQLLKKSFPISLSGLRHYKSLPDKSKWHDSSFTIWKIRFFLALAISVWLCNNFLSKNALNQSLAESKEEKVHKEKLANSLYIYERIYEHVLKF